MKSLRLLVTPDCHKKCPGCCNKDWDLNKLPICDSFKCYDEIILTGGEPMLLGKEHLEGIIHVIQSQNPKAKIILYTTRVEAIGLPVYGITLTLHAQSDERYFKFLKNYYMPQNKSISLRLNIFKGITIDKRTTRGWVIQDNMVWIKNCPLPKNEVFMRLR
jgi:hypothetical protein